MYTKITEIIVIIKNFKFNNLKQTMKNKVIYLNWGCENYLYLNNIL